RAIGTSGYRPKRTLVFAHFAGEELGLHGSRGLAEAPPSLAPFSTGHVVAMLNMDMVGRLAEEGLEVGGEKTSPAWPALLAESAPESLRIKHPEAVTGRSDHAHWFRQGIPVLFFFTGIHSDYHRTSDEFDTLNLEGITEIGELVLGVTLALAEGAEVPATPKK
ncbi:MAG: M28 family peptidase, partial [Nannocystaceae bacterium]|nr:M28 family peptidase [Nannocystaceae bacterium]